MILNPLTGRYVKKNSKVYRGLLRGGIIAESEPNSKVVEPEVVERKLPKRTKTKRNVYMSSDDEGEEFNRDYGKSLKNKKKPAFKYDKQTYDNYSEEEEESESEVYQKPVKQKQRFKQQKQESESDEYEYDLSGVNETQIKQLRGLLKAYDMNK